MTAAFGWTKPDPRIWVSALLLEDMRDGRCGPSFALTGDLLRIEGVNRTVIYRVGEQVSDQYAYYAEFPD